MGIFIKRPLCLFCFCFIGASLFACCIGVLLKLSLVLGLILCAAVFFLLYRRNYKRKYVFLESAIALIFVCIALFQSFFFVDLPREKSKALVSEGSAIEFVVISEEYSSKYSTKYFGKLFAANDARTDVNAYLVFEHEADYLAGDRLLLVGDVSEIVENAKLIDLPKDAEIEITSTIDKDLIIVDKYEGANLSVLCARLGEYVRRVFLDRLDKDSAALSLGILTGDSSMISTEVVRDFRRAGLSHLLAVSGLHLSVLLGAIELLLTKLCVSKGQTVTKGSVIAKVGTTGTSTGNHLHFEVKVRGVRKDPVNFYPKLDLWVLHNGVPVPLPH